MCYRQPSPFIHTYLTVELDDTIGDIKSTISDKQKAILMEIEDIILECELSVQQLGSV